MKKNFKNKVKILNDKNIYDQILIEVSYLFKKGIYIKKLKIDQNNLINVLKKFKQNNFIIEKSHIENSNLIQETKRIRNSFSNLTRSMIYYRNGSQMICFTT